MKKLTVVLMAVAFAFGMVLSAQAANIVNCKTTSEAISKVGCEKAGAISFTFDAGTVITTGDWWYADLPVGVTICSPINYEIVDGAPTTPFATQAAVADGGEIAKGTVMVIKDLLDGTAGNGITAAGGGIYFRVTGNMGSQRVLITALGAVGATMTVDGGAQLTIKILDQQVNATFMYEDTGNGAGGLPPDGIYGNDLPADNLEVIDNTLCINAENLAGNYVNVSYDSLADKFTFTGDNEVAHVMAANAMQLVPCKGDVQGNVAIAGGQAAVCSFDYELPAGYCPGFLGNQLNIVAVNPFDAADYQLKLTIVSPAAGVYFGAPAMAATGFTAAQDMCAPGGVAIPLGAISAFKADGTTAVTTFNAGTCTVAAADQATVLMSSAFTFLVGNTVNKIWVDMPNLVYDSAVVMNGQVVTVKVELIKLPCGTVFAGTQDVATFVTSCAAGVTSNIVLPYFPAMDINAAMGWAWGFALYNNTGADGNAIYTLYEQDGDSGTMTQAVTAHNLVIVLNSDLLTGLTPAATNTGTLGDSPCFININVDWATAVDQAGAFGMLWDGYQAQGFNVEAIY